MTNVVLSDKKSYVNPSYRRSDHPSFQQKKHNLVIDSQGASNRELRTESGTLRFENGVAVLPSDSRAKDIVQEMNETEARHPNQYSLTEKPTVNVDKTHRYYFGSHPAMPWAEYDELGRRIQDPDIKEVDDGKSIEQGADPRPPKRGPGEFRTGLR